MGMFSKVAITLGVATCTAVGDPVIQSFGVWAANQTYQEKASVYHGWTNGFLSAAKLFANSKQQQRVIALAACLETMEYAQAVALIDKFHKDHPELRQQPLAEMIMKALTSPGTPCSGKSFE